MFTANGLFKAVPCPDGQQCKRSSCLFSHLNGTPHPNLPLLPITTTSTTGSGHASSSGSVSKSFEIRSLIPSKRPATVVSSSSSVTSHITDQNIARLEPPSKLQKLTALPKKTVTTAAPISTSVNIYFEFTSRAYLVVHT